MRFFRKKPRRARLSELLRDYRDGRCEAVWFSGAHGTVRCIRITGHEGQFHYWSTGDNNYSFIHDDELKRRNARA